MDNSPFRSFPTTKPPSRGHSSYLLFETKENLQDDVRIPVRLIATDNQEIKNAIIKATNRQTQVNDEQLIALTDFPKKLEDFFPSFDSQKRLYYERRSRQYNGVDGVEKVRVSNMTALVRAFASVFLDLPHRTTRNYKALLKSIGTEIFNADHRLEPYYVAAYSHYRLEYLFRSQIINRELKTARYHILMGFRYLASEDAIPRYFSSREMQRFCEGLSEILWDDEKYKELFRQSVEILKEVASGNLHRDNIRTEPFTKQLIEKLKTA